MIAKTNTLREPHKGVISHRGTMLQSAAGAPKGVLREGVAPVLWADVAAVRRSCDRREGHLRESCDMVIEGSTHPIPKGEL
jgi:hypothetical protein